MKKLYSFFVACTLVFSMHALNKLSTPLQSTDVHKIIKADEPIVRAQGIATTFEEVAARSSRATANELGGEYTLVVGDFYGDDATGLLKLDCDITLNTAGTKATISCPMLPSPIEATYSKSTNKLTFARQALSKTLTGKDENGATITLYQRIEPFEYDESLEQPVKRKFTMAVYYDPETNSITFAENTGLCWAVYTTENYATNSYYGIYAILDFIKILPYTPDPDRNVGWTSMGNATFTDGWVCPGYDLMGGESNCYDVELQQNDENKNVYRLVDPYHGNSPVAQYNQTAHVGYIQFDVTDPDHVTFAPVEAGFRDDEMGLYNLYCTNYLSSLMGANNMTAQEVIEKASNLPATTFKDGVVSLGSFTYLDDNEQPVVDYDARIGINFMPFYGASWINEAGTLSLDMTTKIVFPESGIDNVIVDGDSNAESVYYNLQGVKVDHPVSGSLYIVNKGGKTTKVIK